MPGDSLDTDSRARLLDEIDAFSRNGPPQRDEPARPVFTRERLTFPDLNEPSHRTLPSAAPAAIPAGQAAPVTVPAGGNLLTRLRQQAQAVQHARQRPPAQVGARAFELSGVLGASFQYLDELTNQLNIIKPAIPKTFGLSGGIVFEGMSWVEGAVDFRMLPTASEDRLYETVTLRFRLAAPEDRRIQVERDALGIEPLRRLLHDTNIAFELEERKNGRNQVESALFTFPCAIRGGFLFKADYESGGLILRTRNIDRFGVMEFRFLPNALTQTALDELVRLMLGEQSDFLKRFRRSA